MMTGGSLLGFGVGPAGATTIVNCPSGNLQEAINADVTDATIIVHGTCIGNFAISESLTLQGSGTLNGAGTGTVLTINAGTVSLKNLTIEDGNSFNAGGIVNGNPLTGAGGGALSVTNSTVSDNLYGGIATYGGTLSVTNSTVSDNPAPYTAGYTFAGGGIASSLATTTVRNSTVSDNSGYLVGGGIAAVGGTLSVTNSTVSDNSGAAYGGGIYNDSTLTLSNSEVLNNTATDVGGGIFNYTGATVTQPSTDKGGVSINGNTSGGNGGGIDNEGTVTFYNAAVNKNTAVDGGGIYNDAGSTLSLSDTSVNHNTASSYGGGIYNNGGAVSLTTSVSINSNTADTDGGGIYSTVVLSVPSGDVEHNHPDNTVD
jgi:predicted outer membrane repeat protein